MGFTTKEYELGDMRAIYQKDERGVVSFGLLPKNRLLEVKKKEGELHENMVQLKYTGDIYPSAYSGGISLRNSGSTETLLFEKQEVVKEKEKVFLITYLRDTRGYAVKHVVVYREGTHYVHMYNIFKNESEKPVTLELLESFSLGNVSLYLEGDGCEGLELYRLRSVWSGEGRLCKEVFEDLSLEMSWTNAPHAVRCERYGSPSSMPVNHFFPVGVIHDKKNDVFWGAQIAHNTSWQMEVYRKGVNVGFSGGLVDREFGHWTKTLEPGETLETPKALVSTACYKGDGVEEWEAFAPEAKLDIFMQRFTEEGRLTVEEGPESERTLPVMFNEFCTTWGEPSEQNIEKILSALKGKGLSYFVVDCGWYKQEGIPWDQGMGDYEVSQTLFPSGLEKTVEKIKNAGMVPGLWFEIDNVARAAKVYQETEHFLKRDGQVYTTQNRRFWDMGDPWVQDYLGEKVIGTLKTYGFGYVKMDYNDNVGIGCDGAESLGEGLRQNGRASLAFVQRIKQEIPGILVENCASGGHRLEPEMMSHCAMASFSDAHECIEIPIIAAQLHRVIHPAQSQIWVVVRQGDSLQRLTYSMAASFLGRMCLSGDVTKLNKEQWERIGDGIAFYKEAAQVILKGTTLLAGTPIKSMRHPKGYQVIVRKTERQMLVVAHTFACTDPVKVVVPFPVKKLLRYYGEEKNRKGIRLEEKGFSFQLSDSYEAVAFLLEIENGVKNKM